MGQVLFFLSEGVLVTLVLPIWVSVFFLLFFGYFLILGALALSLFILSAAGERYFPPRGQEGMLALCFDKIAEVVYALYLIWSYPVRFCLALFTPH